MSAKDQKADDHHGNPRVASRAHSVFLTFVDRNHVVLSATTSIHAGNSDCHSAQVPNEWVAGRHDAAPARSATEVGTSRRLSRLSFATVFKENKDGDGEA